MLVSIYNPIELYPPSINAVEFLAKKFDSIILLTHSIENVQSWKFPINVQVTYAGSWPTNLASSNRLINLRRFIYFTHLFRKILRNVPDVVLLYEPYAILAYKLSKLFNINNSSIIWYHNHDILQPESQGKLSIGKFAHFAERSIFKNLNIFSLPSNERLKYFPIKNFKGKYFFIPNYPSKEFYSKFYTAKTPLKELKIIFQGRIADGHGLEAIVALLSEELEGRELSLHLKGIIESDYKEKLLAIANKNNVTKKLFFYGLSAYSDVPILTSGCHVGIAIHMHSDIMNKTLGTSSNKIYEYAALGLPVLLYDNQHFREHLGKFEWALFTDGSIDSLRNCLKKIISQYEGISLKAHQDYLENLNFEFQCFAVMNYIKEISE